MNARVTRAFERSEALLSMPIDACVTLTPSGAPLARRGAVGDPQTSRERFFAYLDAHGLLGEDGLLAAGAGVVSMGDHFDYAGGEARQVGREGEAILRWLAAHPPDQAIVLAGNHDLSRVMELGLESDESFGRARRFAFEIRESDSLEQKEGFSRLFPTIPTPGIARRDYMSFDEGQRALVERLLLTRRMRLAHADRLASGARLLLTHAGVTLRELGLLGCDAKQGPEAIAKMLNAILDDAVDEVRGRWERGERARLSLAPLHIAGANGREGGGLLYHRPADPAQTGVDAALFDPESPRRFDPRALPVGLVQVAGHSAHKKNRQELSRSMPRDAEHDEPCLRTLSVQGSEVRYRMGVHPPEAESATLYLVDAELNVGRVEDKDLFALRASRGSIRS